MRGSALATLAIRSRVLLQWQLFCHDNFGAAGASWNHVEFVHERAHQEDSAAGGAQKIFFRKWIGDVGERETLALIQNVNDHFVASEIDGQMNLFFGAFLIAVVKRVDDTFAHAHTYLVTIVLAKPRGFGYA